MTSSDACTEGLDLGFKVDWCLILFEPCLDDTEFWGCGSEGSDAFEEVPATLPFPPLSSITLCRGVVVELLNPNAACEILQRALGRAIDIDELLL